ncbi:MAG: DUF433 domain-containing protein [Calditrichaeota bacterium]|nr:MAG: DUF433 domain-containing protein [Calditrichota bacterium]
MAEIVIRDTEVKVTDVLRMIGDGFTYGQIVDKYPKLAIADIMMSAKVAEEIIGSMVKIRGNNLSNLQMEFVFKNGRFQSLEELQEKHPRAFEKWNTAEDNNLVSLYKSGKTVKEIATILQRSIGSIRARLLKFGLIEAS